MIEFTAGVQLPTQRWTLLRSWSGKFFVEKLRWEVETAYSTHIAFLSLNTMVGDNIDHKRVVLEFALCGFYISGIVYSTEHTK